MSTQFFTTQLHSMVVEHFGPLTCRDNLLELNH